MHTNLQMRVLSCLAHTDLLDAVALEDTTEQLARGTAALEHPAHPPSRTATAASHRQPVPLPPPRKRQRKCRPAATARPVAWNQT